jgi:hypothetical protein
MLKQGDKISWSDSNGVVCFGVAQSMPTRGDHGYDELTITIKVRALGPDAEGVVTGTRGTSRSSGTRPESY